MINHEAFLKFIEKHCEDVDADDKEIKINSIFCEDTKRHLYCNPSKNAFHCWKTNESGNLFELVSLIGKCSYQEAVAILADDNDLRDLEIKLEKFFAEKQTKKVILPNLVFPPDTFYICNLIGSLRNKAEKYLKSRGLPIDNLFFCVTGKYRERIIIPYYNKDGTLIYWNARSIVNDAVRYMGPDASIVKVGKGDVIFMSSWQKHGEKLYLTEGEFDAMSLTQCSFNGGALAGKEISDKQLELIRPYRICICFDTDKSGAAALNNIGNKLLSNGMEVSYVRPPINIKDWNKMLVELGKEMVNLYITNQEKPFTPWTSNTLRLNR